VSVPEQLALEEVGRWFGSSTPRRQFLFERLKALVRILSTTGKVRHVYLFGSFATAAPFPNDVDLFVVMAAGFTTADLSGDALDVFEHERCRVRYGADVFWVTEAIGTEHLDAILDVFGRDRRLAAQAVLEIIP
jgi:predicted nucleotidyltransferase